MSRAAVFAASLLVFLLASAGAGAGGGGAIPSGNLLANPNAEQGQAATNSTERFDPPGWQLGPGGSTVTEVRYGTPDFPTLADSAAIGGGSAFFAGGPQGSGSTPQLIFQIVERLRRGARDRRRPGASVDRRLPRRLRRSGRPCRSDRDVPRPERGDHRQPHRARPVGDRARVPDEDHAARRHRSGAERDSPDQRRPADDPLLGHLQRRLRRQPEPPPARAGSEPSRLDLPAGAAAGARQVGERRRGERNDPGAREGARASSTSCAAPSRSRSARASTRRRARSGSPRPRRAAGPRRPSSSTVASTSTRASAAPASPTCRLEGGNFRSCRGAARGGKGALAGPAAPLGPRQGAHQDLGPQRLRDRPRHLLADRGPLRRDLLQGAAGGRRGARLHPSPHRHPARRRHLPGAGALTRRAPLGWRRAEARFSNQFCRGDFCRLGRPASSPRQRGAGGRGTGSSRRWGAATSLATGPRQIGECRGGERSGPGAREGDE